MGRIAAMNFRNVAACLLTTVTGFVFAGAAHGPGRPGRRRTPLARQRRAGAGRECSGARLARLRLKLSTEWKQISFEFTASGSASNGTMHFRFGSEPGDIVLDNIQVTDLDAGRDLIPRCDFESGPESFKRDWTFWPTGAANTVGTITVEPGAGRDGSAGLRIKLKAPPGGHWPDFHIYHHSNLAIVKDHHYRVSIWARATPARRLMLAFYQPGQSFVRLGGPPDCFGAQIKLAAEAGVNFVSYPCPMPWPKPGVEADWSGVDSMCEQVLRANPNALLLPRNGHEPAAVVARGAFR